MISRKVISSTLSKVKSSSKSSFKPILSVQYSTKTKKTSSLPVLVRNKIKNAYGTSNHLLFEKNTLKAAGVVLNNNLRYQSTLSYEDDVEDIQIPHDKSRMESWMVNLRGGYDDEWLTGPRAQEWFTGVSPNNACPGTDSKGKIRSLPLPNLSGVTRQSSLEYFNNSWTLYETMFAGLKGEEPFYRPPIHGLRHPQIFYYGHDACLFINKLRLSGVLTKPVNAYFESILEVGVDEQLWDDMDKNDMVWPTVAEVHKYRKDVYEVVKNAIETHPSLDDKGGTEPVLVNQDHPMWALFMGFEHERIHLETSSVLFRETLRHLVQMPENWPDIHPSSKRSDAPSSNPVEGKHFPANRMIAVDTDEVVLGKPPSFPSFGWDNEYGERTINVPPFMASEHMITNGEFWHFVNEGGYRTQEHWCDDGWSWRSHRNIKWPFFWETDGPQGSHQYKIRTIFDVVPMQWDWPVDVNYYEAKAYCRWKSKTQGTPTSQQFRILTEAEHHIIRQQEHSLDAARSSVSADKVMVTAGENFAEGTTAANLNMAFTSQNPVDFFPPSETGHYDTTGNAWEWTEDHFNPLKGFEVHHIYDDFSTPCFDGKHSSIVGGSFMSTGDEASVFARFHFRSHFLQHSGFRLVASDDEAPSTNLYPGSFSGQVAARDAVVASSTDETTVSSNETHENVYETDELLNMYLGLHFPSSGSNEEINPILPHNSAPLHGLRFPQRVAELLVSLNPATNKALDIGCAVGGSSFELARTFDHVDAFDFSDSFITYAKKMQDEENVNFSIQAEGDICGEVKAVHEPGLSSEILKKVNFFTGDACKLGEYAENKTVDTYDGIIMSNLLCRLPDPISCLNAMPHVLNKGGVLVMVTPFSWLEQYTPRNNWLGGSYDPVTKEELRSQDHLQTIMEKNGFEKVHEEEMPLVIREHQRKYQYIISQASAWKKI